jgi:uncharacterized protein YqeY
MSLKKTIENDIKSAMLAKNKEELTALRAIKSLILLAETESGAKAEISEADEMKLLTKAAKQRRESAEIYRKQNRADLAEVEEAELAIISRYLPKMLTETELEAEISKIIAKVGASQPSDLGKVMGLASKELAGKADGRAISEMAKKLLQS